MVLQLIFVAWLSWRRKMTNARMPLMSVGLLFFTVASVFLHFNFKAWMPFANPIIYDAAFAKTDQSLGPLVDSLRAFRTWVADSAPVSVDSLYHNGFVAMFFVSFIAHSLFDKPWAFRRMVMSVNLVLLVGGIAYWLFPAIGPFLYAPGLNQASTEAQRLMILGLRDALAYGYLPSGYFVNPPAAMPSLHVAHAVLFTTFAWRWSPALGAAYLPLVAWIVVEAVASAFHYVIDLPAGVLLAWICYRIAVRLVPSRSMDSPGDSWLRGPIRPARQSEGVTRS